MKTLIIALFAVGLIAPAFATTIEIEFMAGESCTDCYLPVHSFADVGQEVTWKNTDKSAHTVTSGTDSPDGFFDSSLIMASQNFKHTFDTPGVYPYFCMLHPWMVGTIAVGDSVDFAIAEPVAAPTPVPDNSEVSFLQNQILFLEQENEQLRNETTTLKIENRNLKLQVENLNEIVLEQLNVIYTWVVNATAR